jgi:hypothetical protein
VALSPLLPHPDAVVVAGPHLETLAQWANTGPLHLWRDGSDAWLTRELTRPSFEAVHDGRVDVNRIFTLTPWLAVTVTGLRWQQGIRTRWVPDRHGALKLYRAAFPFRHHPLRYWTFDRKAGSASLWLALRLTPLTAAPWLQHTT